MTPAPGRLFSEAEYAKLEEQAPYKSEYYRGEIFAMAGGSPAHSRLSVALVGLLHARVDRRRCWVFNSDYRVRIPASSLQTYPDASAVCGPVKFAPGRTDCFENPVFIAEVLSQSTERYDRGPKFEDYKTISSLREYLLLSQTQIRAELFSRQPDGTWTTHIAEGPDAELTFDSLGVTVRLADIYDGIELSGLS